MIKRYNNYHKHTHYSNVKSIDVVTKPHEYMERALELDGDKAIYFTTEHGYQGNVYEARTLCDKYGLKLVVGTEAYYVKDRFEKDRSNYHIILIALNYSGYKDINRILSQSNIDGIYYRNRIDDELLFSVNPKNIIVTTACTGGRVREKNGLEDWISRMKDYFGDNFLLEVQSHNHPSQKKHNEIILNLSKRHNIKIIHANDSHYIYKEQSVYRDLFLKAKGIVYEEEEGYILDYPTYDEIVSRYREQGILNEEEIKEALDNTLIFDKCEDIILDKSIKMPHISDNPNEELKDIINKEWDKIKYEVPKEKWDKYLEEIRYEFDIIEKTNMEEYFIMDYKIVKNAVNNYNGLMTKTGRGSAPSFYINRLLGLTEIDRMSAPVPLYPTRFMSIERILGTKSLPDIDLNTENREPFIKATEELLGKENCAWMLSFKPLQDSSAFRLWCKANDMKIDDYDDIAKNIDDYRGHEYWGKIIEDSQVFKGVVESISESPCSQLVWDKNISEEIGLIQTKEGLCCNIDGYNCDVYKYLKNDLLQVTVWEIIRKVCELAKIDIPTIKELESLLDEKTYNIYRDKLTCTINQADSVFSTEQVSKYQPKSVAEMSAYVASIRPGFASLLNNFIDRLPYSNGVAELDSLLEDSFHYMMYQESIMKYLIWLGVKESESYDIIKKIAKKKFKEEELIVLKEELKKGWIKEVGNDEGFEKTWEVVQDFARYGFNASHSLSYAYDSLYGAYLKSHYPIEYYTVAFSLYDNDEERTVKLTEELEYFNIKIKKPKFRYSRAEYFMDKESNSIFKGIASIKYLNSRVADELYELRDNDYDSFIDLLVDLQHTSINSRQLDILIKIDFFEEFGKNGKLLKMVEIFDKYTNRKTWKKGALPCDEKILREFSGKETEKQFSEIDQIGLVKALSYDLKDEEFNIREIIKCSFDNIGSCEWKNDDINGNVYYVVGVDTKYKDANILLYNLNRGTKGFVKLSEAYMQLNPISKGDIIDLYDFIQKPKKRKINGKWQNVENEFITYLCDYYIYSDDDIEELTDLINGGK